MGHGKTHINEITLDCQLSPATVKGYFSEFLISNILVTSLSSDWALPGLRNLFTRHFFFQ